MIREIEVGLDSSGELHVLSAARNLNHLPDALCGCNPDAYNTENPFGRCRLGGVWVWFHHPFDSELDTGEAP
jgi:hypothetical protein